VGIEAELKDRAGGKCELCGGGEGLGPYAVPPRSGATAAECALLCAGCRAGVDDPAAVTDRQRWYALRESMWSEHAPVKVLVYRVLRRLDEAWTQELAGQMYLDEVETAWADAGEGGGDDAEADAPTVDSNGTPLQDGDTVTLIKDLDVKGGGFTAKRGTTVKGITLTGDPKYVEGRVNGITIVLVAAYLKKA